MESNDSPHQMTIGVYRKLQLLNQIQKKDTRPGSYEELSARKPAVRQILRDSPFHLGYPKAIPAVFTKKQPRRQSCFLRQQCFPGSLNHLGHFRLKPIGNKTETHNTFIKEFQASS